MIDIELGSVKELLALSLRSGLHVHTTYEPVPWLVSETRPAYITIYFDEKTLQSAFDCVSKATWRVNVKTDVCEYQPGGGDTLHPVIVLGSGMIIMTKKEASRFLGQMVRNRILKARVHSNHSGRLTLDFLPFEPIDIERLRVKGGSQ
jgi:hypothetical protein